MLDFVEYFSSEEFKSLEEAYCSGRDRCQNETALYTLHVELPNFEKISCGGKVTQTHKSLIGLFPA